MTPQRFDSYDEECWWQRVERKPHLKENRPKTQADLSKPV